MLIFFSASNLYQLFILLFLWYFYDTFWEEVANNYCIEKKNLIKRVKKIPFFFMQFKLFLLNFLNVNVPDWNALILSGFICISVLVLILYVGLCLYSILVLEPFKDFCFSWDCNRSHLYQAYCDKKMHFSYILFCFNAAGDAK